MTFLHPKLLWLLLLVPVLIGYYLWRGKSANASIIFPTLSFLPQGGGGVRVYLRHLLFALRMIALSLLVLALARPQSFDSWQEREIEGIDIMLSMDISTSMLALDFQPNRFEASREVAARFVNSRPNDRIGLVAFSGESFTVCPLTIDHAILINRMGEIYPGLISGGTAIGLGLVTAINRLRDSQAKSKVVILLTDGVNTSTDISPIKASDLAKSLGITIYSIGMSADADEVAFPEQSPYGGTRLTSVPVQLEEDMLRTIAESTGGSYFRATDNQALEQVYAQIDKLERTKIASRNFLSVSEEFGVFLLFALGCLVLEFVLRHTLLRTMP